jgi:hypothetical protein
MPPRRSPPPRSSRRRFLELFGAGAAAAGVPVSLLLEPSRARAQAQPAGQTAGGYPKRLVFVVQYNGTVPDAWLPVSQSPLVFGRVLEPLQRHSKEILQITGLKNQAGSDSKYAGCGTHCSFGNVLTGRPTIGESKPGGVSVDQAVAEAIGKTTRFRSVEAAVGPVQLNSSPSATGPGLGRSMTTSPYSIFDRLFGELRLSEEERDRLRARRKSVLDRNGARTEALVGRILGGDAKYKLGAYHQAIREVESALDARTAPGCTVPAAEGSSALSTSDGKNTPVLAKTHIDMLVASLACDLTRVYSLGFWDIGHQGLYPADFLTDLPPDPSGKPRVDAHAFAHDSTTTRKEHKIRLERWQAEQLSYLLDRMKAVKEGDGTLLDHSLVIQIQCMARGDHAPNPLPAVVAGGAAGWKMGRFIAYGPTAPGSSAQFTVTQNDFLVSIAQAFGLGVKTFGEPTYCKGPLPGLHG